MIIVRFELHSAITGHVTELARMRICNTGEGTATKGNYVGETFIGRSREVLDVGRVSKEGRVENYPRQALHVWNLVARMLTSMGYK